MRKSQHDHRRIVTFVGDRALVFAPSATRLPGSSYSAGRYLIARCGSTEQTMLPAGSG